MAKMTKNQLIDAIAEGTQVSKNDVKAVIEQMATVGYKELNEAGLSLDPVFTLKAWRSLLTMSQTGALKNKKVLFWNTYNSFDYMPPLLSSLG